MINARLFRSGVLCAALTAFSSSLFAQADADGFTNPIASLKLTPDLDQEEFERATLNALKINDPLESWNRRVYHFNYRADEWVMQPVVNSYKRVTPRFFRTGVSNFFNNVGDVPNLFNSILQLKGKRALDTTARLLLNTTIGIGGLFDPATHMGIRRQPEDFGQTLGVYGVPSGPYLMLPLLGPSNLRDTTGELVDYGIHSQIDFYSDDMPSLALLELIDLRYKIPLRYGQLNSPFEYEKLRYVYEAARALQIAD